MMDGFIGMCDNDPLFFGSITVEDEGWCYEYDIASKLQSIEWLGTGSSSSKKLRLQISNIKTMLIFFFKGGGHGINIVIHSRIRPTRIIRDYNFLPSGSATHSQRVLSFCKTVFPPPRERSSAATVRMSSRTTYSCLPEPSSIFT